MKRYYSLPCVAFVNILLIYLVHQNINSSSTIKAYSTTRTAVREVEGWGVASIRDPKHYTNLISRILPKNFCHQRSFLLVMVHSAPSNSKNRTAIRKSWGRSEKTSKHNASVYFLLGLTSDSNLQKEIDAESAEFGDIIQEGFVDSYNNLTLKSLMMLKLANLHCKRSVEYLLKVDDDSLVNIAVIVSTLVKEGDPELLMGSTKNNRKPNRNPSRKLYAPYYLYSEPSYPDYFSGGGYWMAMNVAKKLYKQALKTPLFYIEDVYITGICAERANILRQHTHMVILVEDFPEIFQPKCYKGFFVLNPVDAECMLEKDLQFSKCL